VPPPGCMREGEGGRSLLEVGREQRLHKDKKKRAIAEKSPRKKNPPNSPEEEKKNSHHGRQRRRFQIKAEAVVRREAEHPHAEGRSQLPRVDSRVSSKIRGGIGELLFKIGTWHP